MEFTLYRDFSELQPLAADWNHLLAESITHVPFLRHEYLSTWWSTRGGGEWPGAELFLVTARQERRLAGIAPMFLDQDRDGDPALLLLGSIEISDYLDLIVRPEDLGAFLTGLLDFLVNASPARWRALDWQNLLESSPTIPLLEAEAEKRGWSYMVQQTYHAPSIPLKGNFETYLSTLDKKQRHEIRRKIRRAEESGRNIHWYIAEDGKTLHDEVEAFMSLMADDPNKAGFLTQPMREQMHLSCREAFNYGWLQLAFLEVDGKKAAGYLNFDYLNRIWVYNSGVDRRFMELSPGWVLLGYLLQWANDHQRSEFDFLRGEEDYKYRFGGLDKRVLRMKAVR